MSGKPTVCAAPAYVGTPDVAAKSGGRRPDGGPQNAYAVVAAIRCVGSHYKTIAVIRLRVGRSARLNGYAASRRADHVRRENVSSPVTVQIYLSACRYRPVVAYAAERPSSHGVLMEYHNIEGKSIVGSSL